jgi:hypothetical protein
MRGKYQAECMCGWSSPFCGEDEALQYMSDHGCCSDMKDVVER